MGRGAVVLESALGSFRVPPALLGALKAPSSGGGRWPICIQGQAGWAWGWQPVNAYANRPFSRLCFAGRAGLTAAGATTLFMLVERGWLRQANPRHMAPNLPLSMVPN